MSKYIIKKILMLLLTLFVTSFLVFTIFELVPGDPVLQKLGTRATEESIAALREEWGLNRPFIVRYFEFIKGAVTLNFGKSYNYGMAVSSLLKEKLVINITMSLMALLMVILVSFPLGIYVAKHTGGLIDRIFIPINQIAMSLPPFILGLFVTFFFGIVIRLFKPGGFVPLEAGFGKFIYFLIFPAITLAIPKIAMCTRLLKSNILEEAGKDYSTTAYSRGNNTTGLLYKHVLKNAVMPTVTFIGMVAADMICSGIIAEQVFSVPGLGQLLINSVSTRDYPVVEAIVLLIAFLIMIISFITDLIHGAVDPRIRNNKM